MSGTPPPPPPPQTPRRNPPIAERTPEPDRVPTFSWIAPPEPPPLLRVDAVIPSAEIFPSSCSSPLTVKRITPPPAPPEFVGKAPLLVPPPLPGVVGTLEESYTFPPPLPETVFAP